MGLWALRLRDPVLRLGEREDRVRLDLAVDVAGLAPERGGVGFRSLSGHAGAEGTLDYQSETGSFFLRDPVIDRDAMIKAHVQRIRVERDRLVVEYHL